MHHMRLKISLIYELYAITDSIYLKARAGICLHSTYHQQTLFISIYQFYFYRKKEVIFLQSCLIKSIPTMDSRIWNSPSPGHRPRLDPKKLRESMKLNLSTDVFLSLTSVLNIRLNLECQGPLPTVPSSTVATVLKQGWRQEETLIPLYKSTENFRKISINQMSL